MCGIAGILKYGNNLTLQAEAQAATKSMRHRGPDDEGLYCDNDIMMAHTRLSIIDVTAGGHQPMRDEDDVVVFNGEIYNYIELRNELKDRGHLFKTNSDTEVILKAYREWGMECWPKLNGIFAIALWNIKLRRLALVRDRLGVKPLYMIFGKDSVMFASEIKILIAMGYKPEPDYETIKQYLCYGSYGHRAKSFFKEVQQISPGFYDWILPEKIGTMPYWHLSPFSRQYDDNSEAIEDYEETMINAVKINLRSDVGYSLNLSSGLDSSVLYQCVKKFVANKKLKRMYTHTCGVSQYDESADVSRWMAEEGCQHCTVRFDEDDFNEENVRAAVRLHDEPFGGLPTMVYQKLFKFGSACGDKVFLCGEGMDEQFAGYDYYATESDSLIQGTTGSPAMEVLEPEMLVEKKEMLLSLVYDKMTMLRYRDVMQTKIPRSLRFADRISMQYGTELRVPFLDHRLLEIAFCLPKEMLIHNNRNKWLLRQLAVRLGVPLKTAIAPKRTMWSPMREWMMVDKNALVSDVLLSKKFRERGFYNIQKLYDLWRRFNKGEFDTAFFVWQWVNLELWFQEMVDAN